MQKYTLSLHPNVHASKLVGRGGKRVVAITWHKKVNQQDLVTKKDLRDTKRRNYKTSWLQI